MAFTVPLFSKTQVDKAGQALIDTNVSPEDIESALDILSNWRAAHAFPLNTFQMRLRREATNLDQNSIVAQRLKRKFSILYKLQRFEGMQLARMQDIGGCRAVVIGMKNVRKLFRNYKRSRIKHKLVNEKDYIDKPKESGYRGIHLVYRYNSDKKSTYNGLQIEIQLRTRIQHAWATAVEIIGIFIQHSLKSSVGPDQWLRFFSLMGSVFAFAEKSPLVPNTPTSEQDLKKEVKRLARELKVVQKLESYGKTLKTIEKPKSKDSHYYLLYLKPLSGTLSVKVYKRDETKLANSDYLEIEKRLQEDKGAEAVLVSVDSVESLKAAYPNYYLDTTIFLDYLKKYLAKK